MPLVIYDHGGGHTHPHTPTRTCTRICTQTHLYESDLKKPGAWRLHSKIPKFWDLFSAHKCLAEEMAPKSSNLVDFSVTSLPTMYANMHDCPLCLKLELNDRSLYIEKMLSLIQDESMHSSVDSQLWSCINYHFGNMRIDNGYYSKDYLLLGKHLTKTALILLCSYDFLVTSG